MALEAINVGPVNFINFKVDLSVAKDAEVATTVKLIYDLFAQGNNHSGLQHLRRQCRGVATGHSRLLKNAHPLLYGGRRPLRSRRNYFSGCASSLTSFTTSGDCLRALTNIVFVSFPDVKLMGSFILWA